MTLVLERVRKKESLLYSGTVEVASVLHLGSGQKCLSGAMKEVRGHGSKELFSEAGCEQCQGLSST